MATHRLKSELKNLSDNPPEGITAKTINDDLYLWEAVIMGPIGSYYEGGEFIAELEIPKTYPYVPPKMKFRSEMFHPNVYKTGSVCISILHPPGKDPTGYESALERWNPTQSIEKILLSVRALFSDPNAYSPANIDAAILFRENEPEFANQAKKCAQKSSEVAKLKKFREEKEKQDKEYECGLLADQKNAREKEESLAKKRLEDEKRQVDSIKRKNETEGNPEKLSAKRKNEEKTLLPESVEAQKLVPQEPAPDCGKPLTNIRFRQPDGDLFSRRFLATDSLSVLLNFLVSRGYLTKKYKVLSSWPRRDLTQLDHKSTLQELKLFPQETLTLETLDSE